MTRRALFLQSQAEVPRLKACQAEEASVKLVQCLGFVLAWHLSLKPFSHPVPSLRGLGISYTNTKLCVCYGQTIDPHAASIPCRSTPHVDIKLSPLAPPPPHIQFAEQKHMRLQESTSAMSALISPLMFCCSVAGSVSVPRISSWAWTSLRCRCSRYYTW